MKPPRNYHSALRAQVHMWIDKIQSTDILVGIPTYNSEETIKNVVNMVTEGLHLHFPGAKKAVLVADGGSLDDTREQAYEAVTREGVERRVMIYRGLPGKGTSLRAIFEAAVLLGAQACAVVDSDLRSITPEWIRKLIEPIRTGQAGFVVPYYTRHKFDGTITNHLVYPVTRALYGLRVRQPIGGDFGFSRELAEFYSGQDVWLTDVARFGIDVWMTTTAMNEGFKIVQVNLGVKKHNPKDPSADLGPMFCQVISTLFYLMGQYESVWRKTSGSRPAETLGMTPVDGGPDDLAVNLDKMHAEFAEGFGQFAPLYRQILDPANYETLKKCLGEKNQCFNSELWARIVYDFAYVYQTWGRNRRRLVDLLVPLYFGRTADYCRQVRDLDAESAEQVVEAQAETFERLKPYLLQKFEMWEA